jgi:hypothetical protein
LTNNINVIKLNGRPDNYWMNRAIRQTTTKLTDVELLDFLKESYSNTCAHFKVLLPDKNRYFMMGISKSRLQK